MVAGKLDPNRVRPSLVLGVVLMIAVAISYLLWSPEDFNRGKDSLASEARSSASAAGLESGAEGAPGMAAEVIQRESQTIETPALSSDAVAAGKNRAWLELQLVDVSGGDAAAAQSVRVVDVHGVWPWPEVALAVTDEAGAARINVPANRVLIVRVDPGSPMQRGRLRVDLLAEGETREVQLRLHPQKMTQARIQVVGARAEPIVGATITALEQEFAPVQTDQHGVVLLPEIPMFTTVFVRADAPGYGPKFGLIDDEKTEVLLTLEPEAILTGRVLRADGTPAAEADVELYADPLAHQVWLNDIAIEWSAKTDAYGRYEIGGLPAGAAFLASAAWGDALAVVTTPELLAGTQLLDLQLTQPAVLAGRAVDPDGLGVAGVVLELSSLHMLRTGANPAPLLDRFARMQVTTVADGSFRFGPERALHGGRWRLALYEASRRGIRNPTGDAPNDRWLPISMEVELPPGESKEDLLVHLRSGTTITGVMLDPQGRPVQSGVVRAYPDASGSRSRVQTSVFGEGGEFTLGPLEAGTYHIMGNDPTHIASATAEHVAAGTTDLLLNCKSSRGVIGTVVDADGRPIQARLFAFDRLPSDSTMWALRVDGDGQFRLFDSVVEALDIYAFLPDGRAGIAANVQLREQPEEIRIQLEDAVAVEIQVRGIDPETIVGVVDLRGRRIFEGDPWFLENLIWLPEGDLHVELREGSRVLAKADALLLQGSGPVRLTLNAAEPEQD